jgi:hypothetical protein
MRKTKKVALELDRAMPRLKSKGSAPHEPEIGLEEISIEMFLDPLAADESLRFDHQSFNGQNVIFGQPKGWRLYALAVSYQTRLRRRLQCLVPGECFFGYGLATVEGRNRSEEVERTTVFAL